MTARWPGPGHKKTVRTCMHSIVILLAWLYFPTSGVFAYVNSFWSQLHFLFRLERLFVVSDVCCRRRRGRVVWALACRTGVIFAYLREQGRKRGEREARVACVGRFAKNPACRHTIVQALPPPDTP